MRISADVLKVVQATAPKRLWGAVAARFTHVLNKRLAAHRAEHIALGTKELAELDFPEPKKDTKLKKPK